MLRYLNIQRLAVIEALELELGPGFTVLTGETGTGKSIVVEAVDLLLGGRASADLVRTGADCAQVQAVLEHPDGHELVVRREISAAGRSRAFVDGNLVTTAHLREAAGPLIDLHGQHDHQALLGPEHHLRLLDHYAGLQSCVADVGRAFAAFQQASRAVESTQLDERERAARTELLSFQLGEIDRVAPRAGEDDELAADRVVLSSADRLQRQASDAYLRLYEADTSIIGELEHVWRRLAELASLDGRFEPYLAMREAVRPQLDDLALFLRSYVGNLDASPERLQFLEDRLASLERLKRRYGPALDDVLARQQAFHAELASLNVSDVRIAELQRDVSVAREAYMRGAAELSTRRREAAARLSQALEAELAGLAMERARCEIRFQPARAAERATAHGIDDAEFFLAANPGEAARPLARIASGGELSRVMLALKTLATTDAPGKTLVFDEVDAGIGGRAADMVGKRLRQLGDRFQVLCITHLPQVAAHAGVHYRVVKDVEGERTLTRVARLDGEGRAQELARMIAGTDASNRVLAGAREMIATRARGEAAAKGESERAKAKGRRSGQQILD
jgi:DNA repair protein RecN (Recombination protein N)